MIKPFLSAAVATPAEVLLFLSAEEGLFTLPAPAVAAVLTPAVDVVFLARLSVEELLELAGETLGEDVSAFPAVVEANDDLPAVAEVSDGL